MTGVIDSLERAQLRRVPAFQAGDRVRVHFQVVEGTRRRTQVFEGIVHQAPGQRRARDVHRPQAVVRRGRRAHVPGPLAEDRADRGGGRGDVRRAKLYYLRGRVGRARACRERRWTGAEEVIEPSLVEAGAMPADDAPRPGEEELGEQVATEEPAPEDAAPEADAARAEAEEADGARPTRPPTRPRRDEPAPEPAEASPATTRP